MDSNSSLRVEEKLELLENQLISKLVNEWEDNRTYVPLLRREYFRNENFLMYSMFSKLHTENIDIDLDFLKIYLESHKKDFLHDIDRIEFDAFEGDGVSSIDAVLISTVRYYENYKSGDYLVSDSFQSILGKFREVYAGLELQDTLQEVGMALHDTVIYNRRKYHGTEGAFELLSKRMLGIQATLGGDDTFTLNGSRTYHKAVGERIKPIFLCNLPELPTLDNALSGLKTNTLVTMVAPEKGMKSKMSVMVTHKVLLNGHNCLFWGKEGGELKVYSELRATHFNYYYNVKLGRDYEPLSGQQIMEKRYPNEQYEELERVSFQDLFENPNYGELYTPDYPFLVENLEMVIKEGAEKANCKLFVIDYVQIMDSEVYKDERIAIKKAYGKLESLKGKLNVCIWCPAQMSTDAVQELGKGHKRELRNVTAESSEPTKSADVNFMLYTNREMEEKSMAKLMYLPSRTFGVFDDFPVYMDKVANGLYEVSMNVEGDDIDG